MIKKAIILAGGKGTRMSPLTKAVNKQLLPIYDKPLIFYPLSILMLSKIKDILIIVNKGQLNQYQKILPNGDNLGIKISYLEQNEPKGLPDAFVIGEKFMNSELICTGGILAQILPKKATDPLLVSLLEERFKEVNNFSEELYHSDNNLLELIKNIFPDIDDISISQDARSQNVKFECRCSRERSLKALNMLDKKELEDILKMDGKAELKCEFCKNKFSIKFAEIEEIIKLKENNPNPKY